MLEGGQFSSVRGGIRGPGHAGQVQPVQVHVVMSLVGRVEVKVVEVVISIQLNMPIILYKCCSCALCISIYAILYLPSVCVHQCTVNYCTNYLQYIYSTVLSFYCVF